MEDHTACLCRSGTFVSGLCLLLKSPADTADPQAQTGSGKTPQSANQMAQRRVEYRRNLLNFQKQFIKKELFLFLPHAIITVSYTHLDVYKRQVINRVSLSLKIFSILLYSFVLVKSAADLADSGDLLK